MPTDPVPIAPAPDGPAASDPRPWHQRLWRVVVGGPRSLSDPGLYHRLALVPFLAWVGLGADGLSSSAYGPEEAYRSLRGHAYLAVPLAALMAGTVLVISAAYRRIIDDFPHGGGGYVVATKLLGPKAGLVSGAALLVDYVLTITISVAAAGDALFSLAPPGWQEAKLGAEFVALVFLTALNLRGARESVLVLTPIFVLFLVTHAVLILHGVAGSATDLTGTVRGAVDGFRTGWESLGPAALALLLVHAYALGGGTYTGIEAVSNGLAIMREPRQETARRTMAYMAWSLAFTATGILVCYLLWDVQPVAGKTLNAVLLERAGEHLPFGGAFVFVALISEGALLVVAAQAGFMGGPRVLANMAVDSWVPHRFATLSDRLTIHNGIGLMAAAALVALLYTGGDVRAIVVMYSINVFLTFSLAMLGMLRSAIRGSRPAGGGVRWRRVLLFGPGLLLCVTILGVTIYEKFGEGGWLTVSVTSAVVIACLLTRRHYRRFSEVLARLYADLASVPRRTDGGLPSPDPQAPTAVVLVGSYGGLGIHTVLSIFRSFPSHYKNLLFVSVGVIDSGEFKGEGAVESLRARTEDTLRRYVELAHGLGIPAAGRMGIGTDAVNEAERLCLAAAKEFPRATFFAGKVIFERESWYQRLLHNETAFQLEKRLHWAGMTMVVLPARVRIAARAAAGAAAAGAGGAGLGGGPAGPARSWSPPVASDPRGAPPGPVGGAQTESRGPSDGPAA